MTEYHGVCATCGRIVTMRSKEVGPVVSATVDHRSDCNPLIIVWQGPAEIDGNDYRQTLSEGIGVSDPPECMR